MPQPVKHNTFTAYCKLSIREILFSHYHNHPRKLYIFCTGDRIRKNTAKCKLPFTNITQIKILNALYPEVD